MLEASPLGHAALVFVSEHAPFAAVAIMHNRAVVRLLCGAFRHLSVPDYRTFMPRNIFTSKLIVLLLFARYLSAMVETIGEALDHSWRLTARCAWGKREGLKTVRECNWRIEIDMPMLVATRGRDFPISLLSSRMRCVRCGGRRIAIAISPPVDGNRAAARK